MSNQTFGRLCVSLVVAACLVTQASTQPQEPTFKVSVNVVDVDVTVKDAQGNFVTGLTADDFDVFEDGKPQAIQTFSYIELPRERPDRFRFAGVPVSADVRSNRDVESGRVYIIVLDDLNVAPLRTGIVRRHARDFIERHIGPRDLAAVVVTSGRKDAAQEFTSDPAWLLRAVDHFFGQRLQSAEIQRLDDYYQNQLLAPLNDTVERDNDPQQSTTVLNPITRNQSFDPSNLERGQRAIGVLNTIESLSEFLEGVRGRRKALLWFSEGIDYPMADAFSSQSGNEIVRATRDAVNAAARANVNVYALDPRGLIGMTTDLIDSMKSGAPDVMGTDPTKPVGTTFSGTQALLSEMRLTQDSLRTLAEGTGGFAAVDTNSFADGSQLEFAQQPNGLFADSLEVSFFALNEDARAQRGTRAALNLAVRPETYQRVKAQGVRLNPRAAMAPGRYQLRVGARNPVSGRTGTVFYDITVPDFTREPLMMGGLLLSSFSTGAPEVLTPQRDPAAEKLLGAPATSRRTFDRSETVAWSTEIYDNVPKQPRQFDVSARLIDESGRDVFASREVLRNGGAGAPKWHTFGYTGRIPLKDISSGRYLLRVEAQDRSAPSRQPVATQTVITVR